MFVEEPLESYACPAGDRSVVETLLKNRDRLPPLRFDCGSEDQLIEFNRELHRQLKNASVRHEYEEFPGGHSWPYWETHLADMLRFFAKHLQES
jgi:S-formylglutathione hydrolase FrmB